MRAMSRIGGCLVQPESLTLSRTSTGAPHAGQAGLLPSLGMRQYGQVYAAEPGGVDMPAPLLAAVVHVHGLDADPAWAVHFCQVHAVPQHAGLDVLLHRVHGDAGVLVEESAGLNQDLLTWLQRLLEHVAVAMQQQQARHLL